MDTRTGECTRLHDGALPRGDFKWLRGVRAANGCIYCIPACASQVLKIDPSDDSYTLFGGDVIPKGTWKWHGGSLAKSDGNIYCIPANARRVLRIEPATDTVSLHGPDLTDYPGAKNKWYGGIKGKDGSIWGIPYNATRALKTVSEESVPPEVAARGLTITHRGHPGEASAAAEPRSRSLESRSLEASAAMSRQNRFRLRGEGAVACSGVSRRRRSTTRTT